MVVSSLAPACRSIGIALIALHFLAQGVSCSGAESFDAECDYGITLALSGNLAGAESVFVSLLSHSPGDARALTNLGNLELVQGEPDVALVFYGRAAEIDTADAGIILNRAVALMLLGDEDLAAAEARRGVNRAGGERKAASLLGLRYGESARSSIDTDKADETSYVSKGEIAGLLSAALQNVPVDSARTGGQKGPETGERKPTRTWRAAGTRAAEKNVVADVLYWKR
jgi:tetratricopeptide (TPR) repeat protein